MLRRFRCNGGAVAEVRTIITGDVFMLCKAKYELTHDMFTCGPRVQVIKNGTV